MQALKVCQQLKFGSSTNEKNLFHFFISASHRKCIWKRCIQSLTELFYHIYFLSNGPKFAASSKSLPAAPLDKLCLCFVFLHGRFLPNFDLILALMQVIVTCTCKYEKDPIKTAEKTGINPFPHNYRIEAKCCH